MEGGSQPGANIVLKILPGYSEVCVCIHTNYMNPCTVFASTYYLKAEFTLMSSILIQHDGVCSSFSSLSTFVTPFSDNGSQRPGFH